MKKKLTLTILTTLFVTLAWAQDFKLAKNSGRLELRIGRVTVEGYAGNELVFSSRERNKKDDDRAKGLKEINGMGLDDNTGLGINVEEKGNVVTVRQLKRTNSPEIKILVPKGMTVSYDYESQYGGDVSFRNVEAEIEVAAQYNSVELVNVSGPVTAKTIYGHIEATFDQNVKGPLSIVSVYGYADVTLPTSIKANIKLSTSYGELYVSPDFKIEVDRSMQDEDEDRVSGKINGGGMNIDINCSYGKVYLRKK
ncbi:MAG: DUF4097 family beta strand repeat protein [Cyclobacteriaceae bacterium]|nr:DUF4097 family beta strand repeat protein [Cyclobacteriaceae bacterium]